MVSKESHSVRQGGNFSETRVHERIIKRKISLICMVFTDRLEAGRVLAEKLHLAKNNVIVLAIPRGGVEIVYEIAKQINFPLDIVISKKIPYPGQPELAIGAVCNDVVSLDESFVKVHDIDMEYINEEVRKLQRLIEQRYKSLTGRNKFPSVRGKVVILTDDGVATGHTFMAAIHFVRSHKPKLLIAAIPVGPPDTLEIIKKNVDELIVIEQPTFFMAVGEFYRNFEQLEDENVINYLRK